MCSAEIIEQSLDKPKKRKKLKQRLSLESDEDSEDGSSNKAKEDKEEIRMRNKLLLDLELLNKFFKTSQELKDKINDEINNIDSNNGCIKLIEFSNKNKLKDNDIWMNKLKMIKKFNKLKNYQKCGVYWLLLVHQVKNASAILADEMGLGKTAQVCIFLEFLYDNYYNNNCLDNNGSDVVDTEGNYEYMDIRSFNNKVNIILIVVPINILNNWDNEFKIWTKLRRHVMVLHGSKDERINMINYIYDYYRPNSKMNVYNDNNFVIILTTSGMISNNDIKLLKKFEPYEYIIIDEAHLIKNSNTMIYKRLLNQFTTNHKILLTGTPIQNNFNELCNLLQFAMPKIFNSSKIHNAIYNITNNVNLVNNIVNLWEVGEKNKDDDNNNKDTDNTSSMNELVNFVNNINNKNKDNSNNNSSSRNKNTTNNNIKLNKGVNVNNIVEDDRDEYINIDDVNNIIVNRQYFMNNIKMSFTKNNKNNNKDNSNNTNNNNKNNKDNEKNNENLNLIYNYINNIIDNKAVFGNKLIINNELKVIQKLTTPFILRRLKKNVMNELPKKNSVYIPCYMNDMQSKIYNKYLYKRDNNNNNTNNSNNNINENNINNDFDVEDDGQSPLNSIEDEEEEYLGETEEENKNEDENEVAKNVEEINNKKKKKRKQQENNEQQNKEENKEENEKDNEEENNEKVNAADNKEDNNTDKENKNNINNKENKKNKNDDNKTIKSNLFKLVRVCNHPLLVRTNYSNSDVFLISSMIYKYNEMIYGDDLEYMNNRLNTVFEIYNYLLKLSDFDINNVLLNMLFNNNMDVHNIVNNNNLIIFKRDEEIEERIGINNNNNSSSRNKNTTNNKSNKEEDEIIVIDDEDEKDKNVGVKNMLLDYKMSEKDNNYYDNNTNNNNNNKEKEEDKYYINNDSIMSYEDRLIIGKLVLGNSLFDDGSKTNKMLEIVKEILNKKEKVIIFSQFTNYLNVIEYVLRYNNINKYLRLDGKLNKYEKAYVINLFNNTMDDKEENMMMREDMVLARTSTYDSNISSNNNDVRETYNNYYNNNTNNNKDNKDNGGENNNNYYNNNTNKHEKDNKDNGGENKEEINESNKEEDEIIVIDDEDEKEEDEGYSILLVSKKVGNIGLNFTTCNNIILMDQNWNPYNDLQCEDRCHRIGQVKNVNIYKLFVKDTIEEYIIYKSINKLYYQYFL